MRTESSFLPYKHPIPSGTIGLKNLAAFGKGDGYEYLFMGSPEAYA